MDEGFSGAFCVFCFPHSRTVVFALKLKTYAESCTFYCIMV